MLNIMQTADGVKIIDWVDASSGSIAADVCRSYLLYLLYRGKTNRNRQDILRWLPVLAGARLNENVTKQDIETLLSFI